jgi:hypothetical protein
VVVDLHVADCGEHCGVQLDGSISVHNTDPTNPRVDCSLELNAIVAFFCKAGAAGVRGQQYCLHMQN